MWLKNKKGRIDLKGLRFTDLLITIMVGIVFGVIMKFWDDLYSVIKPIMPVARQLLYGMWFMVGPFAMLLIRKPGVAVIASLAGASLSAFIGHGFEVLLYGLVQGLGAELIFASFRYKRFGIFVAGFAGVASCFAGFFLDLFYGYAALEAWALFVKYGLRVISSFIFTGIFAYYIVRALEATGVTNSIRPVSKEDYESLN